MPACTGVFYSNVQQNVTMVCATYIIQGRGRKWEGMEEEERKGGVQHPLANILAMALFVSFDTFIGS